MLDVCQTETRTNFQIAILAPNIEGARFNNRCKNSAPRPEMGVAGGPCFFVFRTHALCFLNDFAYDEDTEKWMNWSYFENFLEGAQAMNIAGATLTTTFRQISGFEGYLRIRRLAWSAPRQSVPQP